MSGISLRTRKPSFFWALFFFTFCDFFPESLVLKFPLTIKSGVIMLLALILLNLLELLDLFGVAVRLVSLWRVLSRDLKVLSVACVLSWGM